MASPIAHSFAGFWTFLFIAKQLKARLGHWRAYLPQLGILILLANLPDVDFLIGLLSGESPNEYHRGFTHSLVVGIFVALALSCVWRILGEFWRSALIYFAAYCSHLLIDLFTGTRLGWNNSGSGIPLWWPSHTEYSSPLILVFGVRHGNLRALLSVENFWSNMYELLVFGAITIVVLVLRARYVQNAKRRGGEYTVPSRAFANTDQFK